jgi:hypothetical protein
MRSLLFLVVSLALGACSNTVSSLHYVPTRPLQADSVASVGGVTVVDQRKEAPARLATIMGTFGNPIKTLDTAKPVKDEVADAFIEGLRDRGMLATSGQPSFQLRLVLRKFDADMIVGRTARIDLTFSVVDNAGVTVFEDQFADTQSDMKFFQTGIFADIADLQGLSQTVLNRAVDQMLDNPAFRAAIARPRAGTS